MIGYIYVFSIKNQFDIMHDYALIPRKQVGHITSGISYSRLRLCLIPMKLWVYSVKWYSSCCTVSHHLHICVFLVCFELYQKTPRQEYHSFLRCLFTFIEAIEFSSACISEKCPVLFLGSSRCAFDSIDLDWYAAKMHTYICFWKFWDTFISSNLIIHPRILKNALRQKTHQWNFKKHLSSSNPMKRMPQPSALLICEAWLSDSISV